MKAILDRQALQVALAADYGGSGKPVLECVKIGNGEVMACDGMVFAKCQVTTEPLEGEEILINAKDIMGAAMMIQHGRIILDSQGRTATLTNEEATVSIEVKLQEGKYPNTEGMLPNIERKAYVALSKHVLSKVLEIAKPSDDVPLKFKIREPSQPVVVISGNTTVYAMPMYLPEEET